MKQAACVLLLIAGCREEVDQAQASPPLPAHMRIVSGSRTGYDYTSIVEFYDEQHHARCWVTTGYHLDSAISCLPDGAK